MSTKEIQGEEKKLKETLSLDSGFSELKFQLGLGAVALFLDTRCETCKKKMYKEVIGFIITPNMIRQESAYVCYRCGNVRRIMT